MSVINIKLTTVVVFNLFSDMHQHTFLDQSPEDQITGSSCFEAKDFGNIWGVGMKLRASKRDFADFNDILRPSATYSVWYLRHIRHLMRVEDFTGFRLSKSEGFGVIRITSATSPRTF